jgi:hypothetical protein
MNTISQIGDKIFQVMTLFKKSKDSLFNFLKLPTIRHFLRKHSTSILFSVACFNLLLSMFTIRFLMSMAFFLFSLKCFLMFQFK